MKQLFKLSCFVLLMLFSVTVYAQRTVSGKVSSGEDNSPLPGVSVVVKGTSTGTTTDVDGNYRVNVPENAILVFSYVGFLKQEVEVGNRSVIDITLQTDNKMLSEVVVTGYGVQTKRELTGSIANWEQLLIRISAACYGIGKIRLLILQLLQTIII
jgi:hypothetical protein